MGAAEEFTGISFEISACLLPGSSANTAFVSKEETGDCVEIGDLTEGCGDTKGDTGVVSELRSELGREFDSNAYGAVWEYRWPAISMPKPSPFAPSISG